MPRRKGLQGLRVPLPDPPGQVVEGAAVLVAVHRLPLRWSRLRAASAAW